MNNRTAHPNDTTYRGITITYTLATGHYVVHLGEVKGFWICDTLAEAKRVIRAEARA